MPVSAVVGVSVAVEPTVLTVAAVLEAAPAALSVKVDVVSVAGSIAALKFAITVVFSVTPVAADNGATDVTVGAVAVVNVQVKLAPNGIPPELVTVLRIVAV